MMKRKVFATISLILLSVFFVSGCGDEKVRIQGKILYDNRPVDNGSISFVGEQGSGTVFGEQFKNGSYSVRVPKGEYLIKITGFETVQLEQPIPGVAGSPPITHTEKPIIPGKYNMFSQMTIVIDGSKKVFDFDLEKAGN